MNSIALAVNNGIVTTTSNEVAVNFGKRHDTVLRSIDNLECSPEFRFRNFAEASSVIAQPNGGTAEYRSFTLTRDGFAFLCMGFTGKEAAQWKEKYIAAFNAMEAKLKQGVSDDDRIRQALGLSTIVGATTNTLVFNQVLKSESSLFRLRLLVGFGSDMTPYAIPLEDDAYVVSLSRLAEMIATPGELLPSNDELANLAKACIERLALRRGFQPAILAT